MDFESILGRPFALVRCLVGSGIDAFLRVSEKGRRNIDDAVEDTHGLSGGEFGTARIFGTLVCPPLSRPSRRAVEAKKS